MDDTSLRTPVLDVHRYSGFRPLRTIWVISCLVFILIAIQCITLTYVFVYTDSYVRCELYYMIMYAQASMWFTFSIIRFYTNGQHKMYLLTRGYFEVYEYLSRYIEWPFYICSIWLSMFLVLTCLYVQYAPQDQFFCHVEYVYSPIIVVAVLIAFQNLLLIPLLATYMVKVDKFNKRQIPPESENGNQYMPSALHDSIIADETGFRDPGTTVDSMLERQADLIRYYKEANEILNKKLFDLTSQGRGMIDPIV